MARGPSAHRACDDFHRTTEARRREFLGGTGGRPGLTRRQIIGGGLLGGLAVYTSRALPLSRLLEAAEADAAAAPDAPVLVTVFLGGGCDLLDTLVPQFAFGAYADLHQGLTVQGAPALGTTGLGLHPSLSLGTGGGIKGLFDRGQIGFLPGIDYANPDLSHFHSRHFWETGLVTLDDASGWLGRWLDRAGGAENPLQGLTLGYDLSPVLRSGRAPVAAVSSPGDAQFWFRGVWGESEEAAMEAWTRLASGAGRNRAHTAAKTANRLAKQVADQLGPYKEKDGVNPLAPAVPYPKESDLGERLASLAALISLPLGIRAVTVEAGGDFDTHDSQPAELAENLGDVSQALAAFQADLDARGVAGRVLTFAWSEFGRRPKANQSQGTDHGAGGVAWVQGPRARGGILSDYPSLTAFDGDDNLAVTVDFRRVYASLLEQWLGTDAAAVIPNAGAFGRLELVA